MASPRGRRAWKDDGVLRWITAGESHGPALVAMLEGMVAWVEVTSDDIATNSPAGGSVTAVALG